MVPDASDPLCCEVPQCPFSTPTPAPGVSPTPGIIPGPGLVSPGVIIGIGKVPTAAPTLVSVTGPDGNTITPTPTIGCYYKGRTYMVADGQWEDGCDFVCECQDDSTGRYQCSQKCPVLTQFPHERCVLVQDPQEPCCMTPFCDFTNLTPFPNGTPTPFPPLGPTQTPSSLTAVPGGVVPTPEPSAVPPGFCVYNGVYYQQGAHWYDGCDLSCDCVDANTGYYTCRQRCKSFNLLSSHCVMKTDPSDSCCLVPDCTLPSIFVTPGPPDGFTGTFIPGQSTQSGFTGVGTLPTPGPLILTGTITGSFTGTGGIKPPQGIFGVNTGYSNACVYKGVIYNQDEMWVDGCDYACTCIDALRGQYQCIDRCSNYYFLPPECVMEPDPEDVTGCCKRAACYPPTPSPPTGTAQGFTGTGPSGSGFTLPPGSTLPGFTGTGTPVDITPDVGTGPTGANTPLGPTDSGFTGTGTPVNITPDIGTGPTGQGPSNVPLSTHSSFTGSQGACVYKGVMHQQGGSWEDGCDYRCTCDDDTIGLYTCTYMCKAFSGLPDYCQLQPDPANACCERPVCNVQGTSLTPEIGGTPTLSPTLSPSITNVVPLGTHTIITGNSPMPLPTGTGVLTTIGGQFEGCVYKGVVHIPGETWDDSCDYTCTCIGDGVGFYRCVAKCPSYPALPQYCSLYSIPGLCCASLSCNIPMVGSYKPLPQIDSGPKPTAIPGPDGLYPTAAPILNPQIVTGYTTTITGVGLPGGGAFVPAGYVNNTGGLRGKCVYQMRMYDQGENWKDGCNECQCKDSFTGYYMCTGRCPVYNETALPQGCSISLNPNDTCCQVLTCPNQQGHTLTNITQILQLYPIVGSFSGGTSGFRPGYLPPSGNFDIVSGQRNGCVYKGVMHPSGSTWEDGCDFDCMCLDGVTGLYQCTGKCVTYSVLPPMCKLQDVQGQCCPKVVCNAETTAPNEDCRDKIDDCYSFGNGEQCRGAYLAWAQDHCPLYCGFCVPTYTTTPEPCVDVLSNCEIYGQAVCGDPNYAKWAHDNCRKFCNVCATSPKPTTTVWTTPESGCFDAISYCADYGQNVCRDNNYKAWVGDNCRKFCGLCGDASTTATSAGTTTPEVCADKLTNCELYGPSSCLGQYLSWARANCRKYCNYCALQVTQTAVTATTTPPICQDNIANCAAYGTQYCDGDYLAWAADNCAATCHLCDDFQATTLRAVTAPGWTVLLKGVSGVSGDLWKLWSSTNTSNENVPAAQYLTNQFRGNYKSQYVNSWSTCHFDRLKVAIYNNGLEMANIMFDVRNSGKNDWFRPENIISSTWNDLTVTPDQFNPASDPNGHQFAVGEFHGCSGTGWFFVATHDHCHFGNGTTPNMFFYSSDKSVAHFNRGQLGEGDVFAVLGQGGVCAGGGAVFSTHQSITGMNNFCFYKGHTYGQYEVWQDGCNYNCTCLDVTTGYYSCVDLCPTYTNLPSGCQLHKQPGECCSILNCPHIPGDGCWYKNHSYPQGTTWQDGCDFTCTCDDGTSGHYTCRVLCPSWGILPSECSLKDPAPGECCATPSCPPGFDIQTPAPR